MEYMQKMKRLFDILRILYFWARLYEYIELIPFYININLQCVEKKIINVSEICFQLKLFTLYSMKCIMKCFKGNVNYILSKLKQAEVLTNCISVSVNWEKDLLCFKHFMLKRHFFKPLRIYAVYYFETHHNSPETSRGDSTNEEEKNHSLSKSQFTENQRSLEVDKTIDRDEVSTDKTIIKPNGETSAADTRQVTSCHQKSYQQEIPSSVQKFFQNFTENNKDYKLLTESKDDESLYFPDLTDFFKKNLKTKTENNLTPNSGKQTIFKLPDIDLYRKSTRRGTSDSITRKSSKGIHMGPSSSTKTFLPRRVSRVKKKIGNGVIEKLVSEIRNEVRYLLKLTTNDQHSILNIIIFRLEKFQPRLKEVKRTEQILNRLKTIAQCLNMLIFTFLRMKDNYDVNEFNTIIFNMFHGRDKITAIVGDANDSNDNPNVTFTRILLETVEMLTCLVQIARPYFNETVSQLLGEKTHLPEGSGINKGNEDSNPDFENRGILRPKIYECERNPDEVKDSYSFPEHTSSDFNRGFISKKESCKTASKKRYINQNVDPTKVKKDHRFQKKFYREIREYRENKEMKVENDINACNSKELEVRPISFSTNETSQPLSPDSIKSSILELPGPSRFLKGNYPGSKIQTDQPEPGFPERGNDHNANEKQQTDKDNE